MEKNACSHLLKSKGIQYGRHAKGESKMRTDAESFLRRPSNDLAGLRRIGASSVFVESQSLIGMSSTCRIPQ